MISPASTGGAQQSIFVGITVILRDSFDVSSLHSPSITDQYLIKLNQTQCWWELTNTDSCRERRFWDKVEGEIEDAQKTRNDVAIFLQWLQELFFQRSKGPHLKWFVYKMLITSYERPKNTSLKSLFCSTNSEMLPNNYVWTKQQQIPLIWVLNQRKFCIIAW